MGVRSYKTDVQKAESACRYNGIIKQFGFSKAARLKTPQEYSGVFERPMRSGSAIFTILAHPNESDRARLGVIVAKRFARKAVVRNQVRRLIRESFRHHQNLLKGLDLVVLLRKGLSQPISNRQFDQTLKRQWSEVVSIWKKSS